MTKLKQLFGVALVTLATVSLTSCGGGGGGGASPPPPAAAPTGTLNGLVASAADGSAVSGASASVSGKAAVTTGANGSFQLAAVPAADRVVVRVSAPGYVDTFAVTAVRSGAVTLARVTLVPVEKVATVDPAVAVNVASSATPAQMSAAANSFVRADNGAAPSGSLTVSLTSIDPAQNPERMPGDYTTGGGTQQIESFGAVAVDIQDAGGNRINLGAGKTATVRIPVSSRDPAPPATIPLFYLDEATGGWVEQGTATLAGTGSARYYEGTVAHFSKWNADRPYETVYLSGCIETVTGIKVVNRTVKTTGADYTGTAHASTDSSGNFRVALRKNSTAALTAQGGTESITPVIVGPYAGDFRLPSCLVERGDITSLPPSIVVQPANLAVDEFGLASFVVLADGATPLRYQWRRNGATIAGATGPAYAVYATAADNGARYSVIITNANGSITSNDALLTVNVPNTAPVIRAQPASVAVQVGQAATFSVTASGAPPLTYQWRLNGAAISGATGNSFTTAPTTLNDNGGRYDVVVTNNLGSTPSAVATLTVTDAPPVTGTYKRPLAATLANTYGVGCSPASAGPIRVAANGDASWATGSVLLSSTASTVSVSNSVTSGASGPVNGTVALIFDNAFSFSVIESRTATSSTSIVSVFTQPTGAVLVSCIPGVNGGIAQPNIAGLAATWMEGASGTLPCNVTAGGTLTQQNLPFAFASGQVTLGARVITLNNPRTNELMIAASDPTTLDEQINYRGEFTNGSAIQFWRYVNSKSVLLVYTSASESVSCLGNRQ